MIIYRQQAYQYTQKLDKFPLYLKIQIRIKWSQSDIDLLIYSTKTCKNKSGKIDWIQVSKKLDRTPKRCKTYYQYYKEKMENIHKQKISTQQLKPSQMTIMQKLALYFLLIVCKMQEQQIQKYFPDYSIYDEENLNQQLQSYFNQLIQLRKDIENDFNYFLKQPWYLQEHVRAYLKYWKQRKEYLQIELSKTKKDISQDSYSTPEQYFDENELVFSTQILCDEELQFIIWLEQTFNMNLLYDQVEKHERQINEISYQVLQTIKF